MAQETSNHKLNKYEEGDTDWTHSPDMQHIEERLVIKDTDANRDNYTPHQTATYVATDTGVVYDGDGSSWNVARRAFQSFSTGEYSAGIARVRDAFDAIEADTLNYQWDAQSAAGVGVYGDGDFTVGPDGGSLTTEAAESASVRTEDGVSQSWNQPTWDKRRRLRASVTVSESDHDEIVEIGTGSMQGASTDKQIGARIRDGILFVRTADGSSKTVVRLRDGISETNQYEIDVDYTPTGTPSATVTVTNGDWTESHTFDESDNLPTGETAGSRWLAWSSYAETQSGTAMDVSIEMVNFLAYPP